MGFDHNNYYHRLLLRELPEGASTALDVGCGTGGFARRLASLGLSVDAVDPSGRMIEAARAATAGFENGPRFHEMEVEDLELPSGHYDYISCLASLHHMPFDSVGTLRDALAPGGVLVVLGCYPERTASDWLWSLMAVPANAAARLTVSVTDLARPSRRDEPAPVAGVPMPVLQPTMPLPEVREQAASYLPSSTVRRLLFWRYLLVYRAPE